MLATRVAAVTVVGAVVAIDDDAEAVGGVVHLPAEHRGARRRGRAPPTAAPVTRPVRRARPGVHAGGTADGAVPTTARRRSASDGFSIAVRTARPSPRERAGGDGHPPTVAEAAATGGAAKAGCPAAATPERRQQRQRHRLGARAGFADRPDAGRTAVVAVAAGDELARAIEQVVRACRRAAPRSRCRRGTRRTGRCAARRRGSRASRCVRPWAAVSPSRVVALAEGQAHVALRRTSAAAWRRSSSRSPGRRRRRACRPSTTAAPASSRAAPTASRRSCASAARADRARPSRRSRWCRT